MTVDPKVLFDRWARKPSLAPGLVASLDQLARIGTTRPDLAEPATTLGHVLQAAFHPPESLALDPDDLARMIAGWEHERPAFQAQAPRLVEATLMARARRVAQALGVSNPLATAFDRAVRSRSIDLKSLANEVMAGRSEEVARQAEKAGLEPLLAASILRFTLLPSLAVVSFELDRVRPEGAWPRGDCPGCGSRPILAESRGLDQRIYYRCGLCAAAWPGERLRCPSCSEDRPKALDYAYVEGEQDRYRLASCQTCRYDWKIVSTLTALTPPDMIVADLATIHLDLLAEDRLASSPP